MSGREMRAWAEVVTVQAKIRGHSKDTEESSWWDLALTGKGNGW